MVSKHWKVDGSKVIWLSKIVTSVGRLAGFHFPGIILVLIFSVVLCPSFR